MLISTRMLEIVKHLSQYQQTSYKEIEQALGIKERNVRYDIDRINEILNDKQLTPIIKEGKGILKIPTDFHPEVFEMNSEYIYSHDERLSILLIYLLFCSDKLNLSQISKDLWVSRSTIKNDFDEIESQLLSQGFVITYNDAFILSGDKKHRIRFMVNELKKYILLIKQSEHLNSFQKYILKIFKHAFAKVPVQHIIVLIDDMLEKMEVTMHDESYNWYVANILCMIWFFENDEIPVFDFVKGDKEIASIDMFISDLEKLLEQTIDKKNKNKMINYFIFLNRFLDQGDQFDMIKIETIVTDFISEMSIEMGIPFQNDPTLIEGLFNHMVPLIQRIQLGVVVDENVVSLLTTKNLEVYEIVTRVIKRIDILDQITNENEIAYLVIHFVASLKRIRNTQRKRVLLVCGHGYGTTTMLKESLLSEYQVEIVDTIPQYKISSYENFDCVDLVITTTKLDVGIDYLQVSPILTELDDRYLINAGISRKLPLSNYYSINRSLDFLKDEDRLRVLDVIRRELGYRDLAKPKTIGKLMDLLECDMIRVVDSYMSWQEAIVKSCAILEEKEAVDGNYIDTIFDIIEQNGFYFIVNGSFALIHGNSKVGVHKTAMSLIVNKQKVKFGEEEIHALFCLSTKDQKEHIPAIVNLMKLEKTTDFIKYVEKAHTSQEVYEILMDYERRMV